MIASIHKEFRFNPNRPGTSRKVSGLLFSYCSMNQIEIAKERLKLENEFQELLKEKKELERSLHCINNEIEKNRSYERLLVLDALEYKREVNFWQTVRNNAEGWLSRNQKLVRL